MGNGPKMFTPILSMGARLGTAATARESVGWVLSVPCRHRSSECASLHPADTPASRTAAASTLLSWISRNGRCQTAASMCLPPPVDHAVVELQAAPLRMKRLDLGPLGRHSWPVRTCSGLQRAPHLHQHSVIHLLLPQLLGGEWFPISTAVTRPYCCRRWSQTSLFLTTAVPTLISEAWASGEGISIGMLSPWSVLNLEFILLEDLHPPCHLTFWLAEVQHPGEASVVGP